MNNDKYIHSEVEDNIYSYWEKNKLFKPKKNSKKYSIVIPPPNVTGSLHMRSEERRVGKECRSRWSPYH